MILAWFAMTLGWTIWSGDLMAGFAALIPIPQDISPLPASLALFLIGSAVISLLAYAVFAVVVSSGVKRSA
jgi:hypothetical protein